MNIICVILAGIHHLIQKTQKFLQKTKVAKRCRRNCALFAVGVTVVAAAAFGFHGVHAAGKNRVSETGQEEKRTETEQEDPQEESPYGLKAILQGVLISQDTQTEVKKVGTSLENVMVGQRVGKREVESSLDFQDQGAQEVAKLQSSALGMSEGKLKMSDEDYQNLLQIVEAEAGGEDMEGKILVANVVFNRVRDPEFPDSISEVIWENVAGSAQFSPTADGRINTVTVSEETREAVNRAIDGEDYSQGALFFMQEEYSDADNARWFKEDLKFLFTHGVHDFYTYP